MTHAAALDPSVFIYVRTIISIIVGLSLGRLLTGLARFVQHPNLYRIFLPHFIWSIFMLIYVAHFWWWEFHLITIEWTFGVYCFIILYASSLFFLCTILFPDAMHEYAGFADYFISRRRWFFGILAIVFVFDIIDVIVKGTDYLHSLGVAYWIRTAAFIAGSLLSTVVRDARFQTGYAIIALVSELAWAVGYYNMLV